MPPKRKKTSFSKSSVVIQPKKVEQNKELFNTNKMNMKLVKLVETLTKNIDLMVSTQESFNNTSTLLQNYTTQEFNEMEYQLKLQIEECESMYNEALKQHNEIIQILENELKEKEYTVSQDYLKRTDELEREY